MDVEFPGPPMTGEVQKQPSICRELLVSSRFAGGGLKRIFTRTLVKICGVTGVKLTRNQKRERSAVMAELDRHSDELWDRFGRSDELVKKVQQLLANQAMAVSSPPSGRIHTAAGQLEGLQTVEPVGVPPPLPYLHSSTHPPLAPRAIHSRGAAGLPAWQTASLASGTSSYPQ